MAREPIRKPKKRYDREPSEWEKGWADLRQEYSLHAIIMTAMFLFGVFIFISGFCIQNVKVTFKMQKAVYLSEIFHDGLLNPFGLIFTIVLTIGTIRFVFWILRRYKKDYHTDRERNYDISDKHTYGDADFQDEYERKKCFYRSDDPNHIKHNLDILGRGIEDGLLYSLRDDLKSMNGHMAIIGMSGSGKSAAFVTNKIYQGVKRGVSMIVTDSKGDLYANTAKLVHKYGYKVKMLNLKSDQLMNSDGCDFFKTLGDDDTKAGTLAETIIKNTEGDEKLDYFAKNELNLLKALILYVSTNKALIKAKKNNLTEIFNMVSTKTLEEMHQIFGLLDSEHPAKQAFNIFAACEPKIQGQILNGMAIRIQILSNKWAKRIVASDEIDLVEPMKSKCIYYVVISDTETAYKFIATLFFADIFIELCSYYDRVSQKCRAENLKNPCIPVDFILDEYANTGAIPDFNTKVTTVRSRQIGITIIIQDIGQLKDMYGDNLANTILNNMPLKMLLKTTDYDTAQYFSNLLGLQTIRLEQRRYDQSATDIVHAHDNYTVSEGIGKRQLMNPDELINSLDNNDLILCVSGFHPVKLKKFMYSEHPMTKECVFVDPAKHTPKWRKEIDARRKAEGKPPIWTPKDDLEIPGAKKKPVKKSPAATSENKKDDKNDKDKKPRKRPDDKPRVKKKHPETSGSDQPDGGLADKKPPVKKKRPVKEKPDKPAPAPKEKKRKEKKEEDDKLLGGYVFDEIFPEDNAG